MNEKKITKISKLLSLVLRHKPESIQLQLDKNGWAKVEDLIQKMNQDHINLDMELLIHVVQNNEKKRFAFNDDMSKIRANQGHSIDVDVELEKVSPPEYLFHGTVEKFLPGIQKDGIKKMNRQHVHLSKDIETATKVALRRGKPIILKIAASKMQEDDHVFYLSENQVWLTDHVPSKYILL